MWKCPTCGKENAEVKPLGELLETPRSYDDTEYHENRAREIERAINSLSLKEDKLAAIMAHDMHRTNQQAFTRLAVAWLKVCGSDDYRYDGRNEASAHVGQALRPYLQDVYLPLI